MREISSCRTLLSHLPAGEAFSVVQCSLLVFLLKVSLFFYHKHNSNVENKIVLYPLDERRTSVQQNGGSDYGNPVVSIL